MIAPKIFLSAIILAAFVFAAPLAPGQTLTTLASFSDTNGADPYYGSLVQGSDGSVYGTTLYGGGVNNGLCFSIGCGAIFKISPNGTLTTLYSFCSQSDCTDGFYPIAQLVEGTDGNFYGTTSAGGFYNTQVCNGRGCGTVFKITPSGSLTTLHTFCSGGNCSDGRAPFGPLVQGRDGNFYGTTMSGGTNCTADGGCGTVFKITPSGTLTPLYSFCGQGGNNCTDGEGPFAGLVQGSDGNFYGTTASGGTGSYCGGSCGTVFKITPSGVLTTLHDFCSNGGPTCLDGFEPLAGLVQGTDGNFYGTTDGGGTTNPRLCLDRMCGTVFKITPTGTLTTLYSFCSESNCTDGYMLLAGLVQASDGNFYGMTWAGGNPGCSDFGCGTAFKITPAGALTTLYRFCTQQNCTDGNSPVGTPVQLANGNLYGTTPLGGTDDYGTVFTLSLGTSPAFNVIHNFTGGPDGGQPAAGPTLDRAGNLYGTAFNGGNFNNCASGCGIVYKLSLHGSSYTLNPLYTFTGLSDGALPDYGAVTIGADGTLYGTTSSGGVGESGTVFNVHPRAAACASIICPWMDTTIHQFGSGNDGNDSLSGVVFDATGNLYGTTYRGGTSGNGTVWQATRSGGNWTESVIYNFAGGSDGVNPAGTLTIDSLGNLYGTTYAGGNQGWGTVFKLTNSGTGWTKTILYNFQNGNDGRAPVGGVIFDTAGNIYGATSFGGQAGGGAVYELSPSGGGYTINVLYGFTGVAGPYNNLTIDASGSLYGTTYRDGADLAGSVFKLTQSNGNWTLTDLHDFTGGTDGGYPTSSVAVDAHGNIFGTASSGGSNNQGVVFEITP